MVNRDTPEWHIERAIELEELAGDSSTPLAFMALRGAVKELTEAVRLLAVRNKG